MSTVQPHHHTPCCTPRQLPNHATTRTQHCNWNPPPEYDLHLRTRLRIRHAAPRSHPVGDGTIRLLRSQSHAAKPEHAMLIQIRPRSTHLSGTFSTPHRSTHPSGTFSTPLRSTRPSETFSTPHCLATHDNVATPPHARLSRMAPATAPDTGPGRHQSRRRPRLTEAVPPEGDLRQGRGHPPVAGLW